MSTGSMLADFFAKFSIKIDEKSVEEMNKKTEQAKSALKRMAVATREEATALTSMHQAAEGLNKSLETLKTFGGMFALFEFGRNIYETVVDYQAVQNQLENVTDSTVEAKAQMKELYNFSYRLGLSFKNTSEDFGQFLLQMKDMGYETSKATKIYEKLLGAFAGRHLKDGEQAMVMRDITTDLLSSSTLHLGRLTNLEINRKFSIVSLGAKAAGLSVEEFKKKAEQGLIKTSEFVPKLIDEMYKKYKGAIDGFQKGVQASFGRLKDSWGQFLDTLGESGAIDLMTSLFNGLTSALNGFTEVVKTDYKLLKQLDEKAPVLKTIAKGLTAIYIASKAFNLLKRSPLFLLLTTIQMIAFAIDDIEGHLNGKKSVTGSLIKWFGDLNTLDKVKVSLLGIAAAVYSAIFAYKKLSKVIGGMRLKKLGKGGLGGLENMASRLVNIEAAVVNVFSKGGKGALGGEGTTTEKTKAGKPRIKLRNKPLEEAEPKIGRLKSIFKTISRGFELGLARFPLFALPAAGAAIEVSTASPTPENVQLFGAGSQSQKIYDITTPQQRLKKLHEAALSHVAHLQQNALSLSSPRLLQQTTSNNTHTAQAISLAPQNTFNFSFNVAAGTTQEQARSMAEMIEDTVNKMQHKQYTHALSTFTNKE